VKKLLETQKAACIREGIPPAETRIKRLDKSIELLCDHGDALCEAMSADFGHRSIDQSRFSDISGSIDTLKYAKKNLRSWMRPDKRATQFPLGLFGARAAVHYQPKGVVGMAELFAQYYEEDEVAVLTGGADVGAEFSSLPFDHLVFTGATSIGRHVMRAAAENLVPLTLELGGKSPVIIGESADLQMAALRIMSGKTLNAGQICLAPDYVFLPEGSESGFVEAAREAVVAMFPDGLRDNDDYTSVVNKRHLDRLNDYLDDARGKGAEVVALDPNDDDFSQQAHHKMAPHLVLNVDDDMLVMQDEIFGPILPIKTYKTIQDSIAYVNQHSRPLGLYYFGSDAAERDHVLHNTTSGGVTINDVFFHVAQEDLPFGGVGPSGMGAYHGKDGFNEFSHRKSVYTQAGSDLFAIVRPPYGEKFRKFIGGRIKR
jgi:coniferyl-aldehyde dehydrogenase